MMLMTDLFTQYTMMDLLKNGNTGTMIQELTLSFIEDILRTAQRKKLLNILQAELCIVSGWLILILPPQETLSM